jgi:hypothetical protein
MGQRASVETKGKSPSKAASSSEKVSDKDRTMLDLKRARDKLKKFRVKLDKDCEGLGERAKQLIREKKNDKALFVLKLRKFKVKEAESVEGQLTKVLQMIQTINWEEQNMIVLQALQSGTQALNKMHDDMPLEMVEGIMEDNEEALARQDSISSVLQSSFTELDNDELESEYAELSKLMLAEEGQGQGVAVGVVRKEEKEVVLPEPPTAKPEAASGLPEVPTSRVEVVAVERKPVAA